MPTLDELTAAPRRMKLAGIEFTIAPLELREWGELQAWFKDNVTSPLQAVAPGLDLLPEPERKAAMSAALVKQLRWPPRVATEEWLDSISNTTGGDAMFLWVVLRKHHPEITLEQANRLSSRASAEESRAVIFQALGIDLPKSQAPSEPPPARKAPRSRSSTTGGRSSTRSTGASGTSPTSRSAG